MKKSKNYFLKIGRNGQQNKGKNVKFFGFFKIFLCSAILALLAL
jgi:hypothetical protein